MKKIRKFSLKKTFRDSLINHLINLCKKIEIFRIALIKFMLQVFNNNSKNTYKDDKIDKKAKPF